MQDSPAHSDHPIQTLHDSGLRAVFAYGNSTTRMRVHGADRHVTRMRDLGVLLPRITSIHGVGLDSEELKVIADNGSSLSVAPATEMMMGHGYPPFTRAAEAGLQLSLGADVEATSAADMFTQMRAAYQASRYSELSSPGSEGPRTTVQDILRYATIGGAQTLGLHRLTGSLTPGKQADLIILCADQPDVTPHLRRLQHRRPADGPLAHRHRAGRRAACQTRRKALAGTRALIDDANALVRNDHYPGAAQPESRES